MSSAPYRVDLHHGTAFTLAQKGATLLFLDVPQGSVLSIDQQAFVVGPRFLGVKMLPPGPHFVAFSSVSKQGEVSPPVWFFVHLQAGEVMCRRWHHDTELLLPFEDTDEAGRYAEGVRRFDFDKGLAPYNLQAQETWRGLSSCLTSALIARLSPAGSGLSSITAEHDPYVQAPKTAAEERLEAQLAARQPQEGLGQDSAATGNGSSSSTQHVQHSQEDRELGRSHYTNISRLVKDKGLSAQELTHLNLDKSKLLLKYLDRLQNTSDLVGELQYAFIAFLMGQSLEGFMQWKAILQLALYCSSAVAAHVQLFLKLLRTLHAQLAVAMQSTADQQASISPMLMDGLLDSNFLQPLLTCFSESLEDVDCLDVQILDCVAQLRALLHQRLGWDWTLADELGDEDAPVIVET